MARELVAGCVKNNLFAYMWPRCRGEDLKPIDFGEVRLRARGSLSATSVSYTHLDVYKRQVCRSRFLADPVLIS